MTVFSIDRQKNKSMAGDDINPDASHDSEDRVGSSNKLMESRILQNQVKLLDECHLIAAALAVQRITRSEGIAGRHSRVLIFIVFVNFMLRLFVKELDIVSPDKANSTIFVGLGTSRTAAIVVEAYGLLLATNIRYISIAYVPIVILFFIGALHVKFRENRSSGNNREREATLRNDTESINVFTELLISGSLSEAVGVKPPLIIVPNILLGLFPLWTWHSRQQGGGIFVFSGFLLFLNSVLGALAVMIATAPVGVSPGAAQVLPVLHKTCITMLLITAHTMAAEWLGEDIIFACMPQLFALLVWFTVRFDHASDAAVKAVNSLTSHKATLVILGSVVGILLISMDAYEKILALWCKRLFWIFCSSSALSYFYVWMLHQWPRSKSNSNGPIQLLNISVDVCLGTTVMFFVPLVYFSFFRGNS